MNESMITKAVRRSNLNLLLLCGVGLAILAVLAVLNLRYYYNFALGPYEMSVDELMAVTDPKAAQRYWVTVSGEDIYDTGIQYIETSDSGAETVEFSYLALLFGERLLLVKQPGMPMETTKLTGSLERINTDEQVEIIDDLAVSEPVLRDAFMPFLLHTGNFRTGGSIGLILGGLVGLACVIGLGMFVRRNADPLVHPILKSLARFGPLEFTTSRIDAEMAGEHTVLAKNFHLTKNWLVYTAMGLFQAVRFEDLAWLYMHVTTTRSYGVAVAKTYAVMARDKFGAQLNLTVGNKEQPALEIIQEIGRRAPWAMGGFSKELEQAWKKDRAGFLAQVETRKGQFTS